MEPADTHIVVLRESLGGCRKPIRPSGTPGVSSTLKHVGLYGGVDDKLTSSTGGRKGQTLLKLIDEYNYAKFTKGWKVLPATSAPFHSRLRPHIAIYSSAGYFSARSAWRRRTRVYSLAPSSFPIPLR
jgi:hypothetical protein